MKLTNPGNVLDEDRTKMRALRARRRTVEHAAYPGDSLATDSQEFRNEVQGTETGFLTVKMEARGQTEHTTPKFNSDERAHTVQVEADTREQTQEAVLRELAVTVPELREGAEDPEEA